MLGAKKYEQRNGEEIVTFHIPSSAVQGNLFSDFKSPTTTQNMLDPASYTGLAGFHKYWGKKPIESIAYLIENLTEEMVGSSSLLKLLRVFQNQEKYAKIYDSFFIPEFFGFIFQFLKHGKKSH